jgi:UDPglucose 6-dehydrogenase
LALIDKLLADGASLVVHDPEAIDNVRKQYGERLTYAGRPYDALEAAEALVIMTEWKEFLNPDFKRMRKTMKAAVIFDGRNVYEPSQMRAAGFTYHSIGRASVSAKG